MIKSKSRIHVSRRNSWIPLSLEADTTRLPSERLRSSQTNLIFDTSIPSNTPFCCISIHLCFHPDSSISLYLASRLLASTSLTPGLHRHPAIGHHPWFLVHLVSVSDHRASYIPIHRSLSAVCNIFIIIALQQPSPNESLVVNNLQPQSYHATQATSTSAQIPHHGFEHGPTSISHVRNQPML